MIRYKNFSGKSNVYAYEYGIDYIKVQFSNANSSVYVYTYQSAGRDNVEQMKILAVRGNGLNSFIQQYVRYLYVK